MKMNPNSEEKSKMKMKMKMKEEERSRFCSSIPNSSSATKDSLQQSVPASNSLDLIQKKDRDLMEKLGVETTRQDEEEENLDLMLFSDPCLTCGSKKRRCVTPSFGHINKKVPIDPPSSMKEAASGSLSSPRSMSCPGSNSLNNNTNDSSSDVVKGDMKKDKHLMEKSTLDLMLFSDPCSTCGSKTILIDPPSSSSMVEAASDYYDYEEEGNFKNGGLDSIRGSNKRKPLPSSGGQRKKPMLIDPTATTSDHSRHKWWDDFFRLFPKSQGNQNCLADIPYPLLARILSRLPPNIAERIPLMSKGLIDTFLADPFHYNGSIITSLSPLSIRLDCVRLAHLCNQFSYEEVRLRLGRFVKELLSKHKTNLSELHLRVGLHLFDSLDLNGWIYEVLSSPCVSLKLEIVSGGPLVYIFPPSASVAFAIRHLGLRCCELLPQKSFQTLRTVSLWSVYLHTVEGLIRNSRALEYLFLESCIVPNLFILRAERSVLRTVVMTMCVGHNGGGIQTTSFVTHITIHMPQLRTFKFEGRLGASFGVFGNQLEATIVLEGPDPSKFYPAIHHLLSGLTNVRRLFLSGCVVQSVRALQDRDSLQGMSLPFRHVEELSFTTPSHVKETAALLLSLPAVRRLFIKFEKAAVISSDIGFLHKIEAEFTGLSYVELRYFDGSDEQIEFIAFLLRCSPTLDIMKIFVNMVAPRRVTSPVQDQMDMRKAQLGIQRLHRVSRLHKSSASAKVLIQMCSDGMTSTIGPSQVLHEKARVLLEFEAVLEE